MHRFAPPLPIFSWRTLIWAIGLLAALTGCGGGGSSSPALSADPLKVDTNYGIEGIVKLSSPAPSVVTLQPDGKLLLAGSRQTAPLPQGNYGGAPAREVYVRRLTTNGAVDSTFGHMGEMKFTIKGSDLPVDMKLQKSGRIVLAILAGQPCVIGFASPFAPCMTEDGKIAERSSNLVALTPDGGFDTRFGQNGIAETDANQNSQRLALAVKSDQSLLLLRSMGIARFGIYGRILDRFSENGVKHTPIPQAPPEEPCQATGEALVVQNNGRIVSAGGQGSVTYADPSKHPGVCIATHDSISGTQTSGTWTRVDGNYDFVSLASTSDDGFVAVGRICVALDCQLGVARYGSDGALLVPYGKQGVARMPIPANTYIDSVLTLPDNSLVVLASTVVYENNASSPKFGTVWMRLDPTGAPVTEFGNQGIVTTALSNMAPTHLLKDAQGRWLVVSVDRDSAGSGSVLIQRTVGYGGKS